MNGRNPNEKDDYDKWLEMYWKDHTSDMYGNIVNRTNDTTIPSNNNELPNKEETVDEETVIDENGYDKYAENRSDDKRRGM